LSGAEYSASTGEIVYPWHFDHMRYLNVTWYIGKLMKPASSCSRWSVSIHRGVHKAEPASYF